MPPPSPHQISVATQKCAPELSVLVSSLWQRPEHSVLRVTVVSCCRLTGGQSTTQPQKLLCAAELQQSQSKHASRLTELWFNRLKARKMKVSWRLVEFSMPCHKISMCNVELVFCRFERKEKCVRVTCEKRKDDWWKAVRTNPDNQKAEVHLGPGSNYLLRRRRHFPFTKSVIFPFCPQQSVDTRWWKGSRLLLQRNSYIPVSFSLTNLILSDMHSQVFPKLQCYKYNNSVLTFKPTLIFCYS